MAAQNPAWVSLNPTEDLLEFRGDGVADFLNQYNTQDVKNLKPYHAALGAFLTQKGKIVSDAWILRLPDSLLVSVSHGYGERVKRHLRIYLDFSEVECRDVGEEWEHVAMLYPPPSEDSREASPMEGGVLRVLTQRLGVRAWEFLVPKAQFEDWKRDWLLPQKIAELHPETLEVLRLRAGLPKMGVDMGEENLVAEVGLDETATSFQKGCYLGQETTARVHSMGRVNKKLTVFTLPSAEAVALPQEILQDGKPVGQLSSSVLDPELGERRALGILQTKALESTSPLTLAETPHLILKPLTKS